nr:HycuOrf-32 hypothetical protein [Hyphantria cunea nucleopolyhedrovirus]UIX56306.1 HycuOrf-32 hypothetical protein [Hyphantria cunea nucleopolyhedrovirus]
MNLFNCCFKYTRLSDETKTRFPFAAMSYVNVALCTFGAVVAGYLSAAYSLADLQFLQYWLLMSLFVTGLINTPLLLQRDKTEAHEIVYELKMLHAMYFGNALVHYGVINTAQSAVSAVLIANLIHCCALALLFVELTVLLGHALHTYSDYRYVKSCFMMIMFLSASIIIIIFSSEAIKNEPLCDNLLLAATVSVAYMLTAIVWAARKEAAGYNLQRVQIMPFNDPPPPFATVEMEDYLKTKI